MSLCGRSLLLRAALSLAAIAARRGLAAVLVDGLVMHNDAASGAGVAGLAKRLKQAKTKLLTRHLHVAERSHLSDLMLRTVTTQALDQAAKHQITV